MNIKRFLCASMVLFFFLFAYVLIIDNRLIVILYNKPPEFWKSFSAIRGLIPANTEILIALALFYTFMFTRFFQAGGWKNGLIFGLYIGVLSGLWMPEISYQIPMPLMMGLSFFFFRVIENVLAGLLIGSIYKK